MLFNRLSEIGKNYVTQLHEECEPYFEKVRLSNEKFAERLRKAMEMSSKELSKNKNADDTK